MEEITPTYYASTDVTGSYELIGSGFENIQSDAIGIWAGDNESPLEWLDSTSANVLFDISVIDNGRLTATPRSAITHTINGYLGAIVSPDRGTIYWVNDTKPLP